MTLWAGRFREQSDQLLWEFTVDPADRRLLRDDIQGSIAHVKMLGATGIIKVDETNQLVSSLERLHQEALSGTFEFLPSDEDVHSAVERRLVDLTGDVGKKVHTGRSRNDQIALDLRLYLHRAGQERSAQINELIEVMVDRAEELAEVVVPSYTHLQQAQPISLGHHLLAYAWMLHRDTERITAADKRIAVSPLGANAGGGSSLSINPAHVTNELGLQETFHNSLDAVSSRDFVAEYAFCCSQVMAHLSRLAEDLVLWATSEFAWVTLPDAYSTGSSALPHKRNPDALELARGRAPRVFGALLTLLAVQKGLPLSYNRDLQEDKRAVFEADDTTAGAVGVLTGILRRVEFHPSPPSPDTAALDVAEALVRRGVPFRDAHTAVGQLVGRLNEEGLSLARAGATDLDGTIVDEQDLALTDPELSMRSRSSPGGGSPDSVRRQIAVLRELLAATPSPAQTG